MILCTTELPMKNYTILGLVKGCSVRSKSVVGDLASLVKNAVGGELKAYSSLIEQATDQALLRMEESATELGADAVITVRFSSTTVTTGGAEVTAYGTAIKINDQVE
jgi:uncharacterized protein YbjQ (UPF0145 family)